jgi:hypothetical protein
MVGKSSRSSYKRNRKGTVSGCQRYKKDKALNVSNHYQVVKYQTSQTGEVDVQNIVGTQERKCEGTVRMQSPSLRLRILKTVKNTGLLV